MIRYKNKSWEIYPWEVIYTNKKTNEEELLKPALPCKEWWENVEKKHEHITIHEFIETEIKGEQINRLEEVNELSVGEEYEEIVSNYVKNGEFPDGFNHVLKPIQIQKENSSLSNYVLDVDMRLTMQELGL